MGDRGKHRAQYRRETVKSGSRPEGGSRSIFAYASSSSSTTGQWSLPVISGQMSARFTRGISRWDTMK